MMTMYDARQGPGSVGPQIGRPELEVVEALKQGDEKAFLALVRQHHAAMLRVARRYVGDDEVAADVVQETWLGVLKGLRSFEGRSSLKTWIFRILTNCAKTRVAREGRTVSFSALWDPEAEPDDPAVAPERFQGPGGRYPGGWEAFPARWDSIPEDRWLARETLGVIDRAIAELPPSQRAVITLRDIEGWTSDEVCSVLGITQTSQRVSLHRARSRVRGALERYVSLERGSTP